jgi:hypothetical protein
VEDADAVPGTTTAVVTAEDGSTRTYTVAWLAETVSVTARSECVGTRVRLAVEVTNAGTAPVAATLETEHGTRRFEVAAGRSVERILPAKAAAVPGGEVRVAVDGERTLTAPYEAADCGSGPRGR